MIKIAETKKEYFLPPLALSALPVPVLQALKPMTGRDLFIHLQLCMIEKTSPLMGVLCIPTNTTCDAQ